MHRSSRMQSWWINFKRKQCISAIHGTAFACYESGVKAWRIFRHLSTSQLFVIMIFPTYIWLSINFPLVSQDRGLRLGQLAWRSPLRAIRHCEIHAYPNTKCCVKQGMQKKNIEWNNRTLEAYREIKNMFKLQIKCSRKAGECSGLWKSQS